MKRCGEKTFRVLRDMAELQGVCVYVYMCVDVSVCWDMSQHKQMGYFVRSADTMSRHLHLSCPLTHIHRWATPLRWIPAVCVSFLLKITVVICFHIPSNRKCETCQWCFLKSIICVINTETPWLPWVQGMQVYLGCLLVAEHSHVEKSFQT